MYSKLFCYQISSVTNTFLNSWLCDWLSRSPAGPASWWCPAAAWLGWPQLGWRPPQKPGSSRKHGPANTSAGGFSSLRQCPGTDRAPPPSQLGVSMAQKAGRVNIVSNEDSSHEKMRKQSCQMSCHYYHDILNRHSSMRSQMKTSWYITKKWFLCMMHGCINTPFPC